MEVYNRKYDLNEEQDFKDFCFFSQTARDLTKENFLQDKCSINAYLKENKKSYLSCGEYYLYNQFNNFIIVKEKKIVFKKSTNKIVEYGLLKKNLEGATSAIIIDCETRLGETKDMKHMLLLNADEDNLENNYASLINELGHQGHPCASFACIAKMFNCNIEIAVNRIINGRFKLIDYTNNEIILFTKQSLKK